MQEFSSPGDGIARTNSNAADRISRPHPIVPSSGPEPYDKDCYQVELDVQVEVAPTCERGLTYSGD